MIKTTDLVTEVKFGKDGKASMAVRVKKGTLTLQQLATEKNIGDNFCDADIEKLPKVEIEFFDIKSIDVLMEALKVMKKNYIPPPPSLDDLALAC